MNIKNIINGLNLSFLKKTSVGLDIGSSQLKLLILEKQGKQNILKKLFLLPVSQAEDLPRALAELALSQSIKGSRVNTSVCAQAMIIRYLAWPKMTARELKSTMYFEAKEHVPWPIDEVNLDCAKLNQIADQENKMPVVLAAVKNTVVKERIQLLDSAGLIPKIIDIDCFCLHNAFQNAAASKNINSSAIAVLNIGARYTNMVVTENSLLKFSRDILFGHQEHCLDNLSAEINSSVDYYENQNGKQVEKIYLSGGGAISEQALGFLKNQLSAAVEVFDVFSGLTVDVSFKDNELLSQSSLFAVALGLALR